MKTYLRKSHNNINTKVTIKVPDWVDEEKLKEGFNRALLELSPKKMPIDRLREILEVKELEEDITEENYVREKEKEKIRWLY